MSIFYSNITSAVLKTSQKVR